MLYDLRADPYKGKEFIDNLLLDIISAEIPGQDREVAVAAAGARLRPFTNFCILAACAAKHSPEFAERGGILHSWDAIDVLELMALATKDGKEELTALLSSWLTNDECDIFYVGERRIEEISEDIEKEWLHWKHSR
jgi:hypothetical protein